MKGKKGMIDRGGRKGRKVRMERKIRKVRKLKEEREGREEKRKGKGKGDVDSIKYLYICKLLRTPLAIARRANVISNGRDKVTREGRFAP